MSLIINDVIFLRRPVLNYVSAPICEAFVSSTGFPIVVSAVIHHAAPTGLTANGCSISWDVYNPTEPCAGTACSGQNKALCYTVYRADVAEGPYSVIVDCMQETELDLDSFGNGFYRVSAITLDGESDLSDPVQVICVTIPAPPTNVASENCFLSWNASVSADCYNVYRADLEAGPYLIVAGCVEALSLYLGPYGDGFYKVSAVNVAGESELSEPGVEATCEPSCVDEEVDAWVQRVLDNGGTASEETILFTCKFMQAIKAAGLRDKVVRLNLFEGDQYAAATVPLIIDVGDPLDVGLVRAGNTILIGSASDFTYVETGATGGMTPLTPQAFFNTGFKIAAPVDINDCGLSFYNMGIGLKDTTEIGCLQFNSVNQIRITISGSDMNTRGWAGDGNVAVAMFSDADGVGLYTVTGTALGVTIFKNGNNMAGAAPAGALPTNSFVGVFAFQTEADLPIQFSDRRSGGYAIHTAFTALEMLDWYAAWQAFQTALGRQV